MSYMNQAAFAPAGGTQELSFDEISEVDGGLVPLAVPIVVPIVVGLIGWAVAKSTDDCTTTTVTTVNGNTTTTRTVTTCS